MSEPAWVALGSRGGIVDWEGGWSAAVAYQQGDVVRHNGIDYIAVNPSTGQSPAAATPVVGGRELAYAEFNAGVDVTATVEASAATIVTAPSVVFDGSPVLIEFFSPYAGPDYSAAGRGIYIGLFQDGTSIGSSYVQSQSTGQGLYVPVRTARRLTPTAGAHTYSIRAWVTAGQGHVAGGAATGAPGTRYPGYIRITLVEPAALNITTYVSDPGYGTTLPASPVDGEEYTLVDSLTAPTYAWRFRYVSGITGANKWVFVGGADLLLRNAGGVLPNGAYGSYGPTFAVPRAGVYNVAWGARMTHPSGLYAYADLYVAAASVASMSTYETAGYVSNSSSAFRASVAAAQTLAVYVQGNGTAGAVDQIWMRVTPVAVA